MKFIEFLSLSGLCISLFGSLIVAIYGFMTINENMPTQVIITMLIGLLLMTPSVIKGIRERNDALSMVGEE